MTLLEAMDWLREKNFRETGYLSWRLGNILVEIHEKPSPYIDVFYRVSSGDDDIHISTGSKLDQVTSISLLFDEILNKMLKVRDSMSTAEYSISTLK